MNLEDIIRMAFEAGVGSDEEYGFSERELLKFAVLIAEDCAKRCDELMPVYNASYGDAGGPNECAAAIRTAYKGLDAPV